MDIDAYFAIIEAEANTLRQSQDFPTETPDPPKPSNSSYNNWSDDRGDSGSFNKIGARKPDLRLYSERFNKNDNYNTDRYESNSNEYGSNRNSYDYKSNNSYGTNSNYNSNSSYDRESGSNYRDRNSSSNYRDNSGSNYRDRDSDLNYRDNSGSSYRDRDSNSNYRDNSGSSYHDRDSNSNYRDNSGSSYRDRDSNSNYRDNSGSSYRDRDSNSNYRNNSGSNYRDWDSNSNNRGNSGFNYGQPNSNNHNRDSGSNYRDRANANRDDNSDKGRGFKFEKTLREYSYSSFISIKHTFVDCDLGRFVDKALETLEYEYGKSALVVQRTEQYAESISKHLQEKGVWAYTVLSELDIPKVEEQTVNQVPVTTMDFLVDHVDLFPSSPVVINFHQSIKEISFLERYLRYRESKTKEKITLDIYHICMMNSPVSQLARNMFS